MYQFENGAFDNRVWLANNVVSMAKPYNYAFIDGANLHFTYENLPWKLDYQKLFNHLGRRLDVKVAYYFVGNIPGNERLYETLEGYGYTLKLKEPSPYTTEEQYCPHCNQLIAPETKRNKGDCDSFITQKVLEDLDIYSKAVLITSDGDFDNLVNALLQRDKLKTVFAPCKNGCSWLLRSAAHGRIAFIDDLRNELEKT